MPQKFNLIISIVNYNGEEYISQCLDLLLKACRKSTKKILVICIDNNSFDSSKYIISKYEGIEKIFLDKNIGFASAHNQILRNWDAEYYLLLNPDTLLEEENNLNIMLKYMEDNPDIAIATCNILDENYRVMSSIAHQPTLTNGFIEQLKFKSGFRYSRTTKKLISKLSKVFPVILNNYNQSYNKISEPLNVKFIYGAYLFLRKSAMDKIGYFDENFFLFWEEIDLCIRARQLKFSIGFNPLTTIIHKYQKSQYSVPELSYFFRIASYFWIFKKYYPYRLIFWSISVSLLQPFFILFNLFKNRKKWMKIHYILFQLSISFGKRYESFLIKFKNDESTLI